MDDSVRIRSGTLNGRTEMPRLRYAETTSDGKKLGSEIAFQTEEKALYIGTNEGNVRLCGANDVSEINARIEALSKRIDEIIVRLEALEPKPTE